jgi:predicted AAA+ superfamily ATPase
MSGSEQFEMMENVSESLSGRIGIVDMMGLSLRECDSIDFAEPFLPTKAYFEARAKHLSPLDPVSIWQRIHRGSMPELVVNPSFDWGRFFGAYVRTYLERDVRKIINVTDLMRFQSFMAAVAARTGSMLNVEDIARDVGVSQPTANTWLTVLQATNIVYLLRPYHTNATKRAVKRPKLYFKDTGLAAYLTRWTTPDAMAAGAMAGAFFETFVVTEILKSYCNTGELDAPLYFYRDKDKNEIDLLIVRDGIAHPLEIKKTASPNSGDLSAFRILDRLPDLKRGSGGVICMSEQLYPLTETDIKIPVAYL